MVAARIRPPRRPAGRRPAGRRTAWLRALLAAAAFAAVGGIVGSGDAQTPPAPPPASPPPAGAPPSGPAGDKPAQIDRNGVLILVRSTLLAVDHANKTGNYTVLRDLGAPGFQAGNNAARLAEIFANLRAQNLDLSGIAVLDPQLTTLPTVGQNGMMRMAGFFPSVPLQINFELLYAPVEGRWRLFGIGLNLGQSGPSAPAPPPEPAPPPPPAQAGGKPAEKPKPPAPPRPAQPR